MPSRRENGTLRPPAKAPAANRLYNLQQANSSSSLVPRGADGTPVPYPISHGTLTSSQTSGASSSTANPGGGGGYPSALDPPFLTNAESHFGRMTLTAPDNMRRKKDKDKEKRAKQRQKKASAAQAAAFALSGGDSNLLSFSQPASENGFAVAGPSRRPAMNRLPSSENRSTNGGSRSGTPSEQTGRLDLLAASAATTSTTTSSGRRRGASHTRPVINDEDSAASRPSSRSSRAARDPAPRRPTSSHSQGAATSAVRVRDAPLAVPSSQRQRSESAPSSREPSEHVSHGPARSTTRRSGSETGREDQQLHPSSNDNASSLSSALAQQASLRRHNIWNDLTDLPGADEPDPDDLPPPFPEGATRPRSPPLPPSILGGEWTEEHRRLQEEAERYRVPDSPPPAFRTDPSDESGDGATDRNGINDGQIRRTRTRRTRRTRRRAERSSVDRAGANDADEAIPPSDASAHASATGSASESSESEGEAERLRLQMAEERVAWEADLLSGLSFEERFRREMERREARERVAVLSANEVNRVRGNTDQVEVRDEWDQGEQEQEQEQEVWEEVREVVSDTQNEISVSDGPETQAGIADGRNGGSGEAEGVEEPVEEAPQPITISEAEAEIELATTTQHEIVATSQQPASTVVSPGATGVHSSQRSAAEGEGDDLTSIQPTSTSSLVSPAGPSTFRSMHTTTLKQEATLRPLATKEHRRTSSDLTSHRATSYSSRSQPTRIRSRPASESHSRFRDDATAAAERRSKLWSSRAALEVPVAPPRACVSEGASSASDADSERVDGNEEVEVESDSEAHAVHSEHDSDSSLEQWEAERAAFEAMREKERKELAARLAADSDSQEDRSNRHRGPFSMPGQLRSDVLHVASLDNTIPRAPPPLVLGRNRGGAAYSSSSASSDTDGLASEDDGQSDGRRADSGSDSDSGELPAAPAVDKGKGPAKSIASEDRLAATSASVPEPELPRTFVGKGKQPLTAWGPLVPITLSLAEAEPTPQEPAQPPRLGDFVEDTSSSRDVSSEEVDTPALARHGQWSSASLPGSQIKASDLIPPKPAITSLRETAGFNAVHPSKEDVRATEAAPSSPRPAVASRLRGLFGTPLVADPQPGGRKDSDNPSFENITASLSRRSSNKSTKSAEQDLIKDLEQQQQQQTQRSTHSPKFSVERTPWERKASADSMASLSRKSSVGSLVRKDSGSSSNRVAYAASNFSKGKLHEEDKAREEALAQIARIQSTSQSRQDSLAALERLLAKTTRPSPAFDSGSSWTKPLDDTSGTLNDRPLSLSADVLASSPTASSQPPLPGANRLSRSGAISSRPASGRPALPVPPPVTYNLRPSARPASFINPRSSVAPLPRGKLPTITDATRHFPPTRQSSGRIATPSWLAHIPNAERERLQAPIVPDRVGRLEQGEANASTSPVERSSGHAKSLNTSLNHGSTALPPMAPQLTHRTAGSRVSEMISKFEPASQAMETKPSSSSGGPAFESGVKPLVESPTKPSSPFALANSTIQSRVNADDRSEQKPPSNGLPSRRPPPPPPLLPKGLRPTSLSVATSSAQLLAQASGGHDDASSLRHNPFGMPQVSPRTLSMQALTRNDPWTSSRDGPPVLPPKSPFMPPEQLSGEARKSLDAALAAGATASMARREGAGGLGLPWLQARQMSYESGNQAGNSNSSSPSCQGRVRPLPPIPAPVPSPWHQNFGQLPTITLPPQPPALPERPRNRPLSYGQSSETRITGDHATAEPVAPTVNPFNPFRARSAENAAAPQALSGSWSGDGALPSSSSGARSSIPCSLRVRGGTGTGNLIELSSDSDLASPVRRSFASSSRAQPASVLGGGGGGRMRGGGGGEEGMEAIGPADEQRGEDASDGEVEAGDGADGIERQRRAPVRSGSIGITELDVLVSRLEMEGDHYEEISTLNELLGPATSSRASEEELASLPVGRVEVERRRMTKQGKVKQKLGVVGVRVDKCGICLSQFREHQMACVFGCLHVFHEDCAIKLLRRVRTCPTCRKDCFRGD